MKKHKIIASIEHILGKTTEHEITVWLVDNSFPLSISSPLLLRNRENPDALLYILVHELVHRYLVFGKRWKDKQSNAWFRPGIKNEALCHFITEKVLGENYVNNQLEIKNFKNIMLFIKENRDKIEKML